MDTFQLIIKDTIVWVTRKKIKYMYLSVKLLKNTVLPMAKISVPMRVNKSVIRSFLISKLHWIREQKQKIKPPVVKKYVDGEFFNILGAFYTLNIVYKDKLPPINARVRVQDDNLYLFIRPNTDLIKRKQILEMWCKNKLATHVSNLTNKWEQIMKLRINNLAIRKMKSCWGTCNIKTKKILLNLELVKHPIECVEYVLVHEMAHLFEGSHNAQFYKYMDYFLPHWKSLKKDLNRSLYVCV